MTNAVNETWTAWLENVSKIKYRRSVYRIVLVVVHILQAIQFIIITNHSSIACYFYTQHVDKIVEHY